MEENDEEEPPYHYERNNSLPELFGDEAHQQSWEKYWAKNGERLIWQSWIEKYIDYINPEYLDQNIIPNMSNETTADSQKLDLEEGQAFTFEAPPAEIVISSPAKQSSENLMIELSSDSKKQQQGSSSHRRYLHSNSNGGNDNLLSPRCDSINSSVPFTIDCTTDSMTNVTRMTISSYGFGSSHVTSESTPTSSQSSKESNTVSSFSESDDDSDNQMATTRAAFECEKLLMANKSDEQLPSSNDKDSEECWQKRWQSHAQENYVKHYNSFMETHRILQEEMSSSFKSDSGFLPGESNAGGSGSGHKRRKKSGRKKGSHSLQRLVANLNLRNDLVKQQAQQQQQQAIEVEEAPADTNDNHNEQSQQSDSTVVDMTETSLMESMGLPTSFASRQESKRSGGGRDPPDERPIVNLKRSHENESEEPANVEVDHIKSQFEMMGYAFIDKKSCEAVTKGEIVYRKKHVRLHNRMLKMFPSSSAKPRHTFFDDDGKEIIEENEQEQENLLHSSSDEDAPPHIAQQPPSSRINNSIVPFTTQLSSSDGNANDEVSEEQVNINLSIDQEYDHVEEGAIANDDERQSAKREKKKKRKGKYQAIIPVEIANDKVLRKYWYKRFSLFSLFDQGIQLDRGKQNV